MGEITSLVYKWRKTLNAFLQLGILHLRSDKEENSALFGLSFSPLVQRKQFLLLIKQLFITGEEEEITSCNVWGKKIWFQSESLWEYCHKGLYILCINCSLILQLASILKGVWMLQFLQAWGIHFCILIWSFYHFKSTCCTPDRIF